MQLRSDAQVAGERELEPAAHRGAADLGERHLRQALQAREDALHLARERHHLRAPFRGLEAAAHQLQVGAGAEGLLVRAQQENGGAGNAVQNGLQPRKPWLVDGVHRRAAERGDGERPFVFPLYEQESGAASTESLRAQHDDMRGILWLLATASAEEERVRYRADLAELQGLFDAHAADEESRMYPVFERLLGR